MKVAVMASDFPLNSVRYALTSISNAYCVLSHTQWPRQSAEAGAGCGMVEIIPLLLCKLSFSPQVPSMILKPILG